MCLKYQANILSANYWPQNCSTFLENNDEMCIITLTCERVSALEEITIHHRINMQTVILISTRNLSMT